MNCISLLTDFAGFLDLVIDWSIDRSDSLIDSFLCENGDIEESREDEMHKLINWLFHWYIFKDGDIREDKINIAPPDWLMIDKIARKGDDEMHKHVYRFGWLDWLIELID